MRGADEAKRRSRSKSNRSLFRFPSQLLARLFCRRSFASVSHAVGISAVGWDDTGGLLIGKSMPNTPASELHWTVWSMFKQQNGLGSYAPMSVCFCGPHPFFLLTSRILFRNSLAAFSGFCSSQVAQQPREKPGKAGLSFNAHVFSIPLFIFYYYLGVRNGTANVHYETQAVFSHP